MADKKLIQVCEWDEVEKLTRRGTMADLVIDTIRKRMWGPKGLTQDVFLSFGGGSIVFDSPLPMILRMNTYCEDPDEENGIGGAEHTRPVTKASELEDAVWLLLSDAFDDLCDEIEGMPEEDVKDAMHLGNLRQCIYIVLEKIPKDTVFLKVWFGQDVSLNWLGENVIYVESDFDPDIVSAECSTEDSLEDITASVEEVITATEKARQEFVGKQA